MISIHALREEGDPHTRHDTHTRTLFLSTPSARRATALIYPQGGFGPFLSTPSARRATAGRHGSSATVAISIHALREEGDPPSSKSGRPSANFYPRPPRGGRLFCAARAASSRVFLSTPSARRATRAGEPFLLLPEISIHALREEGDLSAMFLIVRSDYFYPRPPRGGRHCTFLAVRFHSTISIHALREEGDTFCCLTVFSI